MPTERDLCRRFEVSRPVVRAALGLLQQDGWIARRRGSGSEVIGVVAAVEPGGCSRQAKPIPTAGGTSAPMPTSDAARTVPALQDAFEFRLTIECDSARLAALRRTRQHLRAIESALALMQEPIAERERGDADLHFHLAIADATGNPLYAATLRVVQQQILAGMRQSGVFGLRFESRASDIQRQHRAVVSAIRARDADQAAEAMRAHLLASRFRVLGFEPDGR